MSKDFNDLFNQFMGSFNNEMITHLIWILEKF